MKCGTETLLRCCRPMACFLVGEMTYFLVDEWRVVESDPNLISQPRSIHVILKFVLCGYAWVDVATVVPSNL